jgi:hypothetical protein
VLIWLAIAFAIGITLIKAWPLIRNFVQIVDALVSLPGFIKQTTDYQTKTTTTLTAQSKSLTEIHHETHNNDGSSIKDTVDRIELGVKGLYERVDGLEAADAKQVDRLDELEHTKPRSEI